MSMDFDHRYHDAVHHTSHSSEDDDHEDSHSSKRHHHHHHKHHKSGSSKHHHHHRHHSHKKSGDDGDAGSAAVPSAGDTVDTPKPVATGLDGFPVAPPKGAVHPRRASMTDAKFLERKLAQWKNDIAHFGKAYETIQTPDELFDGSTSPPASSTPAAASNDAPAEKMEEKQPSQSSALPSDRAQSPPKSTLERRHSTGGGPVEGDTQQVDALKYLTTGAAMIKHGRSGPPHVRRFFLDLDFDTGVRKIVALRWHSAYKDPLDTCVPIDRIDKILLGRQTRVFQRHLNAELRQRSFSVLYRPLGSHKSRTLDLVADSGFQREIWTLGLLKMARYARHGDPTDLFECLIDVHVPANKRNAVREKTFMFTPLDSEDKDDSPDDESGTFKETISKDEQLELE